MNESYTDQLEAFKSDKSYFSKYPEKITKKEHALVRFFNYNPNTGVDLTKEQKKFRESLIVPGSKPGDKESSAAKVLNVQVINMAKVIKAGPDSKFKAGDIVSISYEKVRGEHKNPEMELYLKSLSMKGDAAPIPPADTRPTIPNIERHMARYMYKDINTVDVTEEDRLTYLIPDLELWSKY